LAGSADVIVFVVRSNSTSQQDARGALDAITEAKRLDTNVVAVLNQQRVGSERFAGKYTHYYSEA
ncbi:MAG: hypothetical protein KDA94_17025, partial [Acidimicrobiales bacterium]|nr:hypothetical protein [Acidimicrobiales bacterium]